MSKTKATTEAKPVGETTPVVDPIAANEAYMREEIEIELFFDGDKYKDDVTVGVNGKTWLIQRGKKVTVPRYVAAVLENSLAQDKAAAMRQRELESAFERDAKKVGVGE